MSAPTTYPGKDSFDYWVLTELQRGRRLTTLNVAQYLGIISLPQAICRLRKAGYPIVDEWQSCQGDAYRPDRYKEFFMENPSNHNITGGNP